MPQNSTLFASWSFYAANLVLAALMYFMLGRLILSIALPPDNRLMRWLHIITDPIVTAVGAITPRLVPVAVVIIFTIAWLFTARMILSVVGPTG